VLDPLRQLGHLGDLAEDPLAHGAEDPALEILQGDPRDDLLPSCDVEQIGDPGLAVLEDLVEVSLLDDILDVPAHGLVGVDADQALAEAAHEPDDPAVVDDDGALVGVIDQGVDELVAQRFQFFDLLLFGHAACRKKNRAMSHSGTTSHH